MSTFLRCPERTDDAVDTIWNPRILVHDTAPRRRTEDDMGRAGRAPVVAKAKRAPTIRKATPDEIAFAALFAVAAEHIDDAKRREAQAIIMRVVLATMTQIKAEAAYEKADIADVNIIAACDAAIAAQRETCEAGAALARAIKGAK